MRACTEICTGDFHRCTTVCVSSMDWTLTKQVRAINTCTNPVLQDTINSGAIPVHLTCQIMASDFQLHTVCDTVWSKNPSTSNLHLDTDLPGVYDDLCKLLMYVVFCREQCVQ